MKNHLDKDKIKQKIEKDFSNKSILDIFTGKDKKNQKSESDTAEPAVIIVDEESLKYNKSKWFFYRGRISRVQFLAYLTFWGLIVTALYIVFALTVGLSALNPSSPESIGFLGGLIVFIINVVTIFGLGTLHSRRLHDLNISSFFVVLLIIPIVNILLTIFLAVKQGETESNRFGRLPKPFTPLTKGLAYVGPLMYLILISSLFLVPSFFMTEPEEATQDGLVNIKPVNNDVNGEVSFTTSNTESENDSDDDISVDDDTSPAVGTNIPTSSSNEEGSKKVGEIKTKSVNPEINLPMSDEAWQNVSTHTDPDFEDIDGFLNKEKVYVER